jgi:RimJ/RimL family protein N-acetyltransferase
VPVELLNVSPAPPPSLMTHEGRFVRLEPLQPHRHAQSLFEKTGGPEHDWLWTYMSDGPYQNYGSFEADLSRKAVSEDPLFFSIIDRQSGSAVGYASYMRIEPKHRCVEVGHIMYSPAMQRTAGASEAMYLMARHIFEDLGYRRYEWKCNALNQPSRRAALRYGFQFEGIFRQHMIVKGRNRDTAWFSMLDHEWPRRKANFERWLSSSNFDENGRQRVSLSELNLSRSL